MSERSNKILRLLDTWCGIPASVLSGLWRMRKKRHLNLPNKPHIGIICLGAIGDMLLLSALANGIKKKVPDSHIEIICSNANASAPALIADIDSAISFPVARLDKIINHARKSRYDLLIDSTQWAKAGTLVSNLSNACFTVGYTTKGQFRSCGYDLKINHNSNIHELDNFLALGKALWKDFEGRPNLAVEKNSIPYQERKWVYCHMWTPDGPGKMLKEWPLKYWKDLINILLEQGLNVGLTGSKNDFINTSQFIQQFFPALPKNLHNLSGKITLLQLAELFGNARAVISINTGVMHLAALLDVPVVGLHGATNPMRWGPKGKQSVSLLPRTGQMAYLNLGFEFPENAISAMENLPVEDVLDALKKLDVL